MKTSLNDLIALAAARRDQRRYTLLEEYSPTTGPMWHGVIRHPKHGIVRIKCTVKSGFPLVDSIPQYRSEVGTIGRAEAAELLVKAMWGDEARKAGIMPYSAALRTLDWLDPKDPE